YDALFVYLYAFELRHIRPGGDHDILRFERLGALAFDLDLSGRGDTRGAAECVYFVFLQQEFDALDISVDALVLEFHHGREVELRFADPDTHLRETVARLLEQLRGIQQRFRWDASNIETSAAVGRSLFDHRGP